MDNKEDFKQLFDCINNLGKIYKKIKKSYSTEEINREIFCLNKNIVKFLKSTTTVSKKETHKYTFGKGSNNNGKKWSEEQYSMVRQMISENKTYKEIAEHMGRSAYSIECVLIKLGLITLSIDENDNIIYTKVENLHSSLSTDYIFTIERINYIMKLINDGVSISEISIKMKVNEKKITEQLVKLKLV